MQIRNLHYFWQISCRELVYAKIHILLIFMMIKGIKQRWFNVKITILLSNKIFPTFLFKASKKLCQFWINNRSNSSKIKNIKM